MGRALSTELPPDMRRALRRARRLEWLTFAYMASAVVLLALVLGSTQAMKTAWIEDLLGLIPPVAFLVAEDLHNKVLYADAKMNKANWLTASAAMVGVVGIGFGLWRADAAAAAIISLDITKDGVSNLRRAVVDLMDQAPTTVDGDEADPLREELARMLRDLDWVEDVDLRLREEGQVYFGEALMVPSDEANITEKVEDALRRASDLDWRIQDLALTPVSELPRADERSAKERRG